MKKLHLLSSVFISGISAVALTTHNAFSAPYMNAHYNSSIQQNAEVKNFDTDCGLFENCSDTKKGLGAHDAIVSLSALGVIPQNKYTNTSIGGHISTTNAVMPELTLTYFFTDNIAISGIAASTRHELHATGTALGSVDIGSTWVLPPTITLQWHFLPHERFNPYVGVGGTLAFFHNTSPGGKDGHNPIRKLGLDTTVGPAIQVGFDYQLVGDWFLNVDVKQVFLNVTAHANDFNGNPLYPGVKAHTSLDPTLVGVGIGYRF